MRVKAVNVDTDKEEWLKIAYVPSVATEKGSGGAERSRKRRIGVLQRVFYLALRELISASHVGARFVNADGRELLAFPRVLLYLCDQPEERAVLCLKPGQSVLLCITCDVPLCALSSPTALKATQRTTLNTLHAEIEAAFHMLYGRDTQQR